MDPTEPDETGQPVLQPQQLSFAVSVARGNLYFSCELCHSVFKGVEAVALLERDDRVMVVPLTPQSGGGLLLKIRNARGDRVVHAQEFFREKSYLEDFEDRSFTAVWDLAASALVLPPMPKFGSSPRKIA